MNASTTLVMGATLPVHDWQFWVVTLVLLVGVAWMLRGVLPVPWLSRRHTRARSTKRVTLTIEGKTQDKSARSGKV